MKKQRTYLQDIKGSTAIEFAMVALLFLTFLFGIIEAARLYWTSNTLQYAIEDTARYALAHQSATNVQLADYAASRMSDIQIDSSKLTVTTSQTTIGGISFIEVDGTYAFSTMLPLLPDAFNSFTLTAQSRLPYSL